MNSSDLYIYRRNLPHWRLAGASYFVTWRLYPGRPVLGFEERTKVMQALQHFDGRRYELSAYVVMDDHVHAVVRAAVRWTGPDADRA